MNNYSIAVIPGDGIGKEVVPAAQQVIEVAGQRFGFSCKWQSFDWGCERFASEGAMMPEDGLQQLRRHDAIFSGPLGIPVFRTMSHYGVFLFQFDGNSSSSLIFVPFGYWPVFSLR